MDLIPPELRPASFTDKEAVCGLYAAFATEVIRFHHFAPPADTIWEKTLAPAIEAKAPVWVAENGKGIIGAAAIVPNTSTEGAMGLFVYVIPEQRRRGIALRLMDKIREHARLRGYSHVFDMVSLENHASINLMQKAGIHPAAYAYTYTP